MLPRDRRRSGRDRVAARSLPPRWLPVGADGRGCGPRHRRHVGRPCRRPLSARRDRPRSRIPSPVRAAPVVSTVEVGRRWPGPRWAGSGGQLMTALATASGENRPTRPGRHAVAKPVPLGPAAFVGLVRAFHPCPPTLSSCGDEILVARENMRLRVPVQGSRGGDPATPPLFVGGFAASCPTAGRARNCPVCRRNAGGTVLERPRSGPSEWDPR